MKIRENVFISELTTMRLGGKARLVVEVTTPEEVSDAYRMALHKNLKTYVLGGGTNTIGRDEGFSGMIILNKLRGIEILSEENNELYVKAMGGEIWDDLVAFVTEKGYSGVEALSSVPGTVGAAPVQNIGAYGQEVKNVVEYVEAYDTWDGGIVEIPAADMQMGYRRSIFNYGAEAGRYFILSVTLKLKKDTLKAPFYNSLQKYLDENEIYDYSPENIRQAVMAIRASKLPDPKIIPSAGSFFKNVYLDDEQADVAEKNGIKVYRGNNENKINTGWLIEGAGLKGKLIDGMRVCETAALILINENAKSYANLASAREKIIKTVKDKYGYTIEQEPVEIKEER